MPSSDLKLAISGLLKMSGYLFVQKAPEKELNRFDSFIKEAELQYSISDKQLFMKGASLQNTEWAIGIVAYVGENTKLMLNSQKGRVKLSHLEK